MSHGTRAGADRRETSVKCVKCEMKSNVEFEVAVRSRLSDTVVAAVGVDIIKVVLRVPEEHAGLHARVGARGVRGENEGERRE